MKIKLHPLFVVYAIVLIIMGQGISLVIYFAGVLLHELGHYFVAKNLGYNLDKMLIMPYGVCLNYNCVDFADNDEIKIAIAGPLVNLMLALITIAFWWIFPASYYYTSVFAYANLVNFFFNLLPCFPLDGGRVMVAILAKKFERKKAIKMSLIFNICVCIIFCTAFLMGIFFQIYNFNLIIISVFLLSGIIEPKKYSTYNYIKFETNKKSLYLKGAQVKILCFNSSVPLYKIVSKLSKNKFNIIYIIFKDKFVKTINEITLAKILQKYNPSLCANDIIELIV